MDTGLGFVQPLFFVGVVENRDDPRVEGRVQVRAFGIHGSNRDVPTDELPWATLIIGNHDVNFTPPPLNAWVFGFFIDGRDAQQPMILGLIPTQATELVNPELYGWGTVPVEDYDRQSQGSRPRDLGLSPMSKLATGEFINETYNEALEVNRVLNVPVAGGGIRGHNSIGNGNAWGSDINETQGQLPASRPVSATEQGRIDDLDSDQQFQSELKRVTQKHGITREQIYGIIAGESNYNPNVINSLGYAGFFQFGKPALADINRQNGTDYTPKTIAQLSPAEQLRVYDKYLDRWNFRNSSGLGIIQAAPAFASKSGDTEVYPRGSNAWNSNPGWRGSDGRITVDSINAYYNRRNPPAKSIDAGFDTSEVDLGLTSAVKDVQDKAEDIRRQIREVDSQLAQLRLPEEASLQQELQSKKKQLEDQLLRIDPTGSTTGGIGETYSGYMHTPAYTDSTTYWDEPPSAYSAQYPFNRVIETASGHSIELDDTPGAERIMIWHNSGSYFQIAPTSTTHKSVSDSYDIHERNHHIYIRGNNLVTIEGDSHVLVKGNKVEEIQGDYKQIVHGNILIGGAGKVEINGADRTDIRSAALGLDSNVENLNIRTSKSITFDSGESIDLNSKNIRIGASENMSVSGGKALFMQSVDGDTHIKAAGSMFLNPDHNVFLKTDGGSISMQSKGSFNVNSDSFIALKSTSYTNISSDESLLMQAKSVNLNSSDVLGVNSGADLFIKSAGQLNLLGSTETRLSSSGDVHIRGSVVYVDDVIQLANDDALTAETKAPIEPANFDFVTGDVGQALPAEPAKTSTSPASDGMSSPPSRSVKTPSTFEV